MTDETQYWLVAQSGLSAADIPEYLAKGVWQSANPAGHRARLQQMRVGDRIALKSTRTATRGVSFFNADRPVSVMAIRVVGTVEGVDHAQGAVRIRWELGEPRDWYFFTYVPALSKLDPDGSEKVRKLIDFAFHGAQQDLGSWLADPYWRTRYPPAGGFTWIPWYEEFASALMRFRDDRAALVSAVMAMAADEPIMQSLLNDRFADGDTGPMRDLDPFTLFGTFNRGITVENRQHLIERMSEVLGIGATVPRDLDAVPVLNNQKSWFVRYDASRGPGDIEALWRVFAAGLSLVSSDDPGGESEFVAAFDAAQQLPGVKWNLSTGLFWSRPHAFPTLDSRSREFIGDRFGVAATLGGAAYLAIRAELQGRMSGADTTITSFPLLSYTAWSDSTATWPAHTIAGFASWGARMAESVDLDDIEHDYKRTTSELLREAKAQIDAGDAGWPEVFKRAVASTNTLNFHFKEDLRKGIAADPPTVAALFSQVWSRPQSFVLDDLLDGLTALLGKVTPGNATALGAALLMAIDVEGNAPYSPTRVGKWHRLTGTDAPGWTAPPSQRYADMLAWLGALAGQLEQPLGARPTILEAQGVAWATTEQGIPASWTEGERAALASWRADSGEPPRAWLVRAKHPAAVADWVEEGYVALAAAYLADVPAGAVEKAVRTAVESRYHHVDYAQREALIVEYHAFLSRMKIGDLVAVPQDTSVHVGVIAGDPHYVEAEDGLRRKVQWRSEVQVDRAEGLGGLLELQGTLVDITQGMELLAALLGSTSSGNDEVVKRPRTEAAVVSVVSTLPPATADLANRLHMDVPELQEIVDLLQSRQQIVMYGPPGTGKTYLAMALARHVVGPEDRSRAQLVQFHPSYAYEDFFEGFRPAETGQGQATFKLQPGPLRRIASAAIANAGTPFVLVIDELNRANLAKVFGELYFLLEYRNESIALQYNPSEAFKLPKNLFLIGTMNTADRSIALLDAAMRRRFSFVELHPDEPPVRDVLAKWLSANGWSNGRAHLLRALNSAIEEQDRDMRIGPSYLMREEASTSEGLERVWKYDIMPLLEEHFYGRLSRQQIHDRFGLEALGTGTSGALPSDPLVQDDSP